MKPLLFLALTFTLSGCISAAEYDQDKAYTACRDNPVKTSRDRCIARGLRDAERHRQQQAEEAQKDAQEADQRQIDRVIAGAEED